MRAYGSRSFSAPRKTGRPWKWLLFGLLVGLVGGFVTATVVSLHKPIELVISAPARPETIVEAADENEIWSESGNISVRTPGPNAFVSSPLVVEGLARLTLSAGEGKFDEVVVRLKDGKDKELAKVATTGTAPEVGLHGPYRAKLVFDKPATRSGTLEVFQNSPKDGSEIDKVTVPVRFE